MHSYLNYCLPSIHLQFSQIKHGLINYDAVEAQYYFQSTYHDLVNIKDRGVTKVSCVHLDQPQHNEYYETVLEPCK